MGPRSSLLNPSDDCDSSRTPLSYSSRGLYSRKSSTSFTGSTKSSSGLSSSRGEKQSDASPWSSSHLWSSSRRDGEMKSELGLSGLGEGRVRSGLASSLYQPERVTSTYAQGARPKESTYSPYYSSSSSSSSSSPSSSSAARDGPLSRHSSSSAPQRSVLGGRSLGGRTTSHYLNVSSTARPSEQRAAARLSAPDSSSRTSRFGVAAAPPPSPPAPTRPAPDGEEPGGYRTCRRLLSRLFSRQSSQDSSSGSSSLGSLDGGSKDSAGGGSSGGAQKSLPGRGRSAAALTRTADDAGASSWQPSAPLGHRSPHLLPRRPAGDLDTRSSASTAPGGGGGGGGGGEAGRGGGGGGHSSQHLPRRWAYLQHSEAQAEDQDQEDQEGAVGFGSYADGRPRKLEEEEEYEAPPELRTAESFTARRRVAPRENSPGSLGGTEKAADEERDSAGSGSDQERLRKIKERLLLEESDEDEGDLCRICQMGEDSASNPLLQPCHCTGSLQFVHQDCIKRWLCSKIHSGTNLESVTTCELCKKTLHLDIDDFDVEELYRTYVQSECENFISSSLHLVGRFFDALEEMNLAGFNLVRILHEQMVNSEVSHSESEGEIQDNRPSIDFSDLEDDSEEEF